MKTLEEVVKSHNKTMEELEGISFGFNPIDVYFVYINSKSFNDWKHEPCKDITLTLEQAAKYFDLV